jgi:endonuclease III
MDVHVSRVARRLDLIEDEKVTWKNAEALTGELRKFDPEDPVKYDFALFGLGVMEKFV